MLTVTLVSHTPEPQRLIENCARISYESQNAENDPTVSSEFIRRLVERGHLSPLEHATATFYIDGISRACSHQFVRHRLMSITQRSGRYTVSDGEIVNPYDSSLLPFTKQNQAREIIYKSAVASYGAYRELLAAGVPKEDARFVLPQAETTALFATANFREWRFGSTSTPNGRFAASPSRFTPGSSASPPTASSTSATSERSPYIDRVKVSPRTSLQKPKT